MDINEKKVIGERIRVLRESRSCTEKRFATYLYAPDEPDESEDHDKSSIISKIEAGKQLPHSKMLIALAEGKLSTSDKLLFGMDDPLIEEILDFINEHPQNKQLFLKLCLAAAQLREPDTSIVPEPDYDENGESDDDTSSVYSQRLCEVRRLKGPLDYVKKLLGLSTSAISRAENSPGYPRTSYLIKFCEALGCSADYILLGTYPSLPSELKDLLVNFSYSTQQDLLQTFCDIADILKSA